MYEKQINNVYDIYSIYPLLKCALIPPHHVLTSAQDAKYLMKILLHVLSVTLYFLFPSINNNNIMEHQAYQLVQVLKKELTNNFTNNNNNNNSCNLSHTTLKVRKSLFSSLIKRKPKMKIQKNSVKIEEVKNFSESEQNSMTALAKIPEKNSFLGKIINISKESKLCINAKNKCIVKKFTNYLPTSYIAKDSIKLMTGVHQLEDILNNLNQSEEHIICLLKKYIRDEGFQTELLDKSLEYFTLQYGSKSQANALANSLWLRHVEMTKKYEHNLQKQLKQMTKNNRKLQLQVEAMKQKLACKSHQTRFFRSNLTKILINNNKNLLDRFKTLNQTIVDLEENLEKIEDQKDIFDQEKQALKSEVFHLETVVKNQKTKFDLEKCFDLKKFEQQDTLLFDCQQALQDISEDLHNFKNEFKELGVPVYWTKCSYQNAGFLDLLNEFRRDFATFFMSILEAYKNVSSIAKNVTKLRDSNSRLQEHLQRSTSELDNLSKILGKNTISKNFQIKCQNFDEENAAIAQKIEDFVTTIWRFESNKKENYKTTLEKLQFLQMYFVEILSKYKNLVEQYQQLEEDNCKLVKKQELLQKDVEKLKAESNFFEKTLSAERQTVTSLQTERVKYLEEKNLLKTVFQHFKNEIARIQLLENKLTDATQENTNLTLIAEFNEQLGKQLKCEIDRKNNAIMELNQNLEALSQIQLNSNEEKQLLSVQLSEINMIKDKLSDSLQLEMEKNIELDEKKKKLEHVTKSQFKIYDKMQKNERAALKELLKEFKNLVKQRDYLVQLQKQQEEQLTKKEKQYNEVKQLYDNAINLSNKKDEEIIHTKYQLKQITEKHLKIEEEIKTNTIRNDKTMKKIEKLLEQLKKEKSDLESSNIYLKTNVKKLQNEIDTAREKETNAVNNYTAKIKKTNKLENENILLKNQIDQLTENNNKLKCEIDFLSNIYDSQNTELKDTKSINNVKNNNYLEMQHNLISQSQQIVQLNKSLEEKENKLTEVGQECEEYKKKCEEQERIMIGYENHIVLLKDHETVNINLEQALNVARADCERTKLELSDANTQIEKLSEHLKTQDLKHQNEISYLQNQTAQLIFECSQQKKELQTIPCELQTIKHTLHEEKKRFEEIGQMYEDLKMKHSKLLEDYDLEVAAHVETCSNLEAVDRALQAIINDRELLQQDIQTILAENNAEKEANTYLVNEINKLKSILEKGQHQYNVLLTKNNDLENKVKLWKLDTNNVDNNSDIISHEQQIAKMSTDFEEKQNDLFKAKMEISSINNALIQRQETVDSLRSDVLSLQQQVATLELTNYELTLQLHETETKLKTERILCQQLQGKESALSLEMSSEDLN